MQRRLRILLLTACGFFLLGAASAQMAAFRDLTLGWRAPSERLTVSQSCDKPASSIADEPPSPGAQAKSLELTIMAISPAKLEIGNDFDATVRLKNAAHNAILVPAMPDGEHVLRTSADGSEEKYEVGDVSFRLATGKAPGVPIYLDSAGALFADPEDKASYLSLAPGSWLEIKLHARVECGLADCPAEIQPDNKATLTAWWYQRVLIHRVNGCNETRGSSKIGEVDSAPFSVVVKNSSNKSSALAWKQ